MSNEHATLMVHQETPRRHGTFKAILGVSELYQAGHKISLKVRWTAIGYGRFYLVYEVHASVVVLVLSMTTLSQRCHNVFSSKILLS